MKLSKYIDDVVDKSKTQEETLIKFFILLHSIAKMIDYEVPVKEVEETYEKLRKKIQK